MGSPAPAEAATTGASGAPAERGNGLAAVGFADVEFDVSFASRFVRLGTGNRRLPESLDLIRHNR